MAKQCFKCRKWKHSTEYYRHPQMKDGRLNKCKDCTKSDVGRHRAENLDRVRAYDRRRAKTVKRRTFATENTKRWREANPEKYRAHVTLNNAVRDGKLKRQSCEECGDPKTHAHHDDYSKPLDVRWLCAAHHLGGVHR